MAGTRKRSNIELGHDAFLDIVANLVGILIILVVILGTRSQQVTEQLQAESEVTESDLAQLATATSRAEAARSAYFALESELKQTSLELKSRQLERDNLNDLLLIASEKWKSEQEKLDQESRKASQLIAAQSQLETELESVRGTRTQLEASESPVVSLEHLPTPMAKTVFGDEIHFRLKDNRLSVVPLDSLVEAIKRDFTRSINGQDGITNSRVGPIQGYIASYEMERARKTVSQGGRVGMATQIQLVGLTVEPIDEPYGQPMDKILAGQSVLDIELAGRVASQTTITVWVYPDSFASMRKLKELLYERGFPTAARPLPMGQPISGSPNGTRSSAQ
ncbi:hypothetical protein FF011L_49930 [Roseimaritima multifibrata]|uniref:Uncharacterized protein n=1 Tax=Roseimaritima multifibrata TaxID=1930274 RepID=A0A517MMS2_9BACT|nr:hypothetical protein [Roseimaritima multifibrata]QDS96185.1 hypothetical protein FF011L_49930 [Roseimaritima multifibrata]